MTETKHFCDKCRRVILEDRTVLVVGAGPLLKTGTEALDLCLDCQGLFMSWLREGSPRLQDHLSPAEAAR